MGHDQALKLTQSDGPVAGPHCCHARPVHGPAPVYFADPVGANGSVAFNSDQLKSRSDGIPRRPDWRGIPTHDIQDHNTGHATTDGLVPGIWAGQEAASGHADRI